MDTPDSVSGIIDLLAEHGLLATIGLTPSHARVMKARGSIPLHWHQPIVEAARPRGLPIDYETLARLAAGRTISRRAKKHEQAQGLEG